MTILGRVSGRGSVRINAMAVTSSVSGRTTAPAPNTVRVPIST
jgi:hypothetical protein